MKQANETAQQRPQRPTEQSTELEKRCCPLEARRQRSNETSLPGSGYRAAKPSSFLTSPLLKQLSSANRIGAMLSLPTHGSRPRTSHHSLPKNNEKALYKAKSRLEKPNQKSKHHKPAKPFPRFRSKVGARLEPFPHQSLSRQRPLETIHSCRLREADLQELHMQAPRLRMPKRLQTSRTSNAS